MIINHFSIISMGKKFSKYTPRKPQISQEPETPAESAPFQPYSYGELSKRTGAYIIDIILIAIPIGLYTGFKYGSAAPDMRVLVANLGFSSILVFSYVFFFSLFNNGQTLGQAIFKLSVMPIGVMDPNKGLKNTTMLTPRQAALHALGKIHLLIILDVFIGFIMKKGTQEPTRLCQWLAGTVVVEKMEMMHGQIKKK